MSTKFSLFKSRLVSGVVGINCLVFCLVSYSAYIGKLQYDNQARVTAENITRVLEKNIDGVLDTVDVALMAEKAEAERQLATGVIDKSSFDAHLANLLVRIPEMTNLRMADERGDILYGTGKEQKIANVADRDYFTVLRDSPGLEMTISKPLLGRVSNQWIIIVSRRVNAPDGSFAGVIHGNIPLEYFKHLFSTLQIGNHGIITLRNEDLTIISRHPETAISTPGNLAITQDYTQMVKSGFKSGSYMAASKIDGIERLFAYRKSEHYPLYINCGVDPHDYLPPWYRETAKMLAMYTLFLISTLFLARFFLKTWKEEQLALQHEQLELLNRTLQKRVDEAVVDLRQKDQILISQSRQAAMGEMIGNIAHQWRQPLNLLAILIADLQLAHQHNELTDEYMNESTEDIHSLIQKMSSTINDFRNFFSPDKDAVAFSALLQVRLAVEMVEEAYRNNSISIKFDPAADCILYGFPNEYSQVLLNLLNNAKDAIIETGTREGRIDIALRVENGMGVVTISDNGGGIPESVQDKIFEPYFSTKESGTGIGLYMSKMIIERNLKGRINIQTREGGTEFSIAVPLAKETA